MLGIGDVFMWSNYQHVRDPHKKDRWFIYLGETKEINGGSVLYPTIYVPMLTTTASDFHYDPEDGDREAGNIIKIRADEVNGFDCDCIIDTRINTKLLLRKQFYDGARFITVKGRVSSGILVKIYESILKTKPISPLHINQIRVNLSSHVDGVQLQSAETYERRHKRRHL
ncbi:MAG: hypothetical protein AB7D08_09645 [Bacteroidales bacterium]